MSSTAPSTLRALARAAAPLSTRPTTTRRLYHGTAAARFAYKDSQDRGSLKPSSAEGTQSGRDDDVAAHSDAAFNPRETRPETEAKTAGKGSGGDGNPLNASGANQELSKPMGEGTAATDTGPGRETRKGGRSGGASPQKKGTPENV